MSIQYDTKCIIIKKYAIVSLRNQNIKYLGEILVKSVLQLPGALAAIFTRNDRDALWVDVLKPQVAQFCPEVLQIIYYSN